LLELILWLWLLWLAWRVGGMVLRLLLPVSPGEAGRGLFATGLGFGMMATGMTLLGLAQLYRPGLIGTILGLLTVASGWDCWKNPPKPGWARSLGGDFRAGSRFEQFCLILAGAICLRNVLGAMTPEMRHDVLDYHLNFPNLYVLHGGMYETPWHVFSYMPSNMEALYSLALLLSTDLLPKLIHCGFSLLAAGALYQLGRRYLGRRIAAWALAWWILIPPVSYVTSTAYIEMGLSLWEFLAIGAILRWLESKGIVGPIENVKNIPKPGESLRWLVLCGLYTGWALASKYTAFLLFFLPLAGTLFFLAVLPDRWKKAHFSVGSVIPALLIIGVIAFALVSPWLIRNAVWTGNPVYPLFNHRLGLDLSYQADAERFMREHASDLSSWRVLADGVSDQLNQLAIDGTLIVNLFILLAPFLGAAWLTGPRSDPARWRRFLWLFLATFASLVLLLWFVGTANKDGRFMMPSYMVLCWLLAAGYFRVFRWFESMMTSWRGFAQSLPWILTVVLALNYTSHLVHFYQDSGESPFPVLGGESQKEYRMKRFPHYGLIEYIDRELPRNVLVLGVGYPTQRPYISHVKHGLNPLSPRLDSGDPFSADLLAQAMSEAGITHLAYPTSFGIPPGESNRLIQAGFELLYEADSMALYQAPKPNIRS